MHMRESTILWFVFIAIYTTGVWLTASGYGVFGSLLVGAGIVLALYIREAIEWECKE